MAELFMECEEEELEPWQQKAKPIVVDDDDDDDDEPIFVGEILSSKPTSTYILNRVNPSSPRIGMQNGAPKRGAVAVSPGFHSATRPATTTLAVQPQPRVSSVSGTSQVLQRPLSGCSSPQEAAKSSAGISPPIGRSATLSRNLSIPVLAQSASRPVATVTAQPVALNRVPLNNISGIAFSLRQNAVVAQCQSGPAVTTTGLSKRPSTSEADCITPKKAKASEIGSGSESPVLPSVQSPNDTSLLQKGITCTGGSSTSSNVKTGAPFPQACPKCNIHFNLLEPLKNHIKYCCPDMVHTFPGTTDGSSTSSKIADSEKGKLIMLVNDFYYGKHEGNIQQVRQEQKTHTTFKCASCMKLLKSNIRFMNHMKHHLELEKQNSESWESHTTCQHCYRQFPTPFQLQCHIESTHTPHESSTVCKICELSFETEQVVLQHMKDNHKPGEMPYVCQVCNYRSSAFSDVEKHFRAVHENTKNLLCPFCLKVIKIGAPYMHHFMRHQKKGVHRCNKCRLQFLTGKEKVDHKSQHHRTFKKPAQLEGLPPGTKVTIRASVGSLHPASTTAPSVSPNASTLQWSASAKVTNTKIPNKLTANKTKTKPKPLSLQKKQSVGNGSSSSSHNSSGSSSSSSSTSNKKTNKIVNTALNNLRCPDIQKCIECYSDIRTFASHFPAYVRCSLCRYSTSCSKAYVNHMMSFHSSRQSKRFWIYKAHSDELRGFTVVCLNCDFLTDVSGLDKMATHLIENYTHTCQVIVENVPLDYLAAADLSDLPNNALLNNENEEKSQKLSRPSTPGEQNETSVSVSPQIKGSAEETDRPHLGNQSDDTALAAECEENKSPLLENSFGPELQACSNDPVDTAEAREAEELGKQHGGAPSATEDEEKKPPLLENIFDPELQACLKDSAEAGTADSFGNQTDEDILAAECKGNAAVSTVEDSSISEIHTCSKDSAGEGNTANLANQGEEGPLAAKCEGNASTSIVDVSSISEVRTCSKDSTGEGNIDDLGNQGEEAPLAAECEGNASVSTAGNPSISEVRTCSEDSVGEENIDDLGNQGEEEGSLAAEYEGNASVSTVGDPSISEVRTCSEDSVGEENIDDLGNQGEEGSLAAECEGNASVSTVEDSSISELHTFSKDSAGEGNIADLANQGEEGLLVAECEENASGVQNSVSLGLATCSNDHTGGEDAGCLTNQGEVHLSAAECEENSSSSVPENSTSGALACSNDFVDPSVEAKGDKFENEFNETSLATDREESISGSTGEESSISEPHACSKGSPEEMRDHLGHQADDCEGNISTSPVKNASGPELQACSAEISCGRTESDNQEGEEKSLKSVGNETNPFPSSEDAVPDAQTKVVDLDEAQLEDKDPDISKLASDQDVSFEQFLRGRGEPDAASSDASEQGSIHLEPLTPSEVLEHEATEILQKGGAAPSSRKAGPAPEQADASSSSSSSSSSREGSPSQVESSVSQAEGSDEAS
ncbi:zinc finger protein 280D isoform X2 [Elgaria multicarinata webbii]